MIGHTVCTTALHFTSSLHSTGDYAYGLPNLILVLEMVLFSAGFWFSYPVTDYPAQDGALGRLSFFRAIADALNPSDLISGFAKALGRSAESRTSVTYHGNYENLIVKR